MRQERSRRLARAVLWRPGNRTSKSRLQSSSNLQRTGRAPSASSFLYRSDLPHEACVKSVLEDSPARSCGVRERSGRANPAFSLRATCNALAQRLPLRRSSIARMHWTGKPRLACPVRFIVQCVSPYNSFSAARQYHFTASLIGGSSASSSASVHQRIAWCSSAARVVVPRFTRAK